MRALHLCGVPAGETPPYSFPHHLPPASTLGYTASGFPVPRPVGQHCYLIRVLATSLTRSELTWSEVLEPSRFKSCGGAIPCHDLVGIIEKVVPPEPDARLFKEGDRVWGLVDFDRDGAAAEYVTAAESELCLAPNCPQGVVEARWIEQLATLPISALTAWQALFVHGGCSERVMPLEHKLNVLVLGSGAVAMAVIELAKTSGHDVAVVASSRGAAVLTETFSSILLPRNVVEGGEDFVQRLISDEPDSTAAKRDLIVDTMGGQIVSKLLTSPLLQELVKPGGKFVSIAAPISVLGKEIGEAIEANCEAARVTCEFFVVRPDREQLQKISKVVEAGKLRGVVESVWPLEKGREAMERVETRGALKRGKVVLTVLSPQTC